MYFVYIEYRYTLFQGVIIELFVLPPHVADLDGLGVPGPGLDCPQLRGLPRRVEGGVAHAGQHRDLGRGQVVQVQGPHLPTHNILHTGDPTSLLHIISHIHDLREGPISCLLLLWVKACLIVS